MQLILQGHNQRVLERWRNGILKKPILLASAISDTQSNTPALHQERTLKDP